MRILRSGKEIEITNEDFLLKMNKYDRFIIDLGTGQGAFVYYNALENNKCFYVGLDSCGNSMKKYAIKQYKNRVNNLIYVIMNAQKIDDIFKNRFSEIYINLPWGTLLEGIFKEELGIVNSISSLALSGCKINICFSYDDRFEKCEIERRGLPKLNTEYFEKIFKPIYEKYNIDIKSIDVLKGVLNFRSKWMHVLSESKDREFYLIVGEKK